MLQHWHVTPKATRRDFVHVAAVLHVLAPVLEPESAIPQPNGYTAAYSATDIASCSSKDTTVQEPVAHMPLVPALVSCSPATVTPLSSSCCCKLTDLPIDRSPAPDSAVRHSSGSDKTLME